jgi:hypothetical protein
MSEPFPRWVGWAWMGGCWRRICEGDTLGICSRLLGNRARQLGILDKQTILTGGGPPSVVPLESHRIAQDATEGAETARESSGEREGR